MATYTGEITTVFNNSYINTDPGYVKNLDLWRLILKAPDSKDVTGLGGILPIVVDTQQESKSVKVSFSITQLNQVVVNTPQTQAFNLLQHSDLPSFAPQAASIRTVLPVNSLEKQGAAVLYFDIKSLPKCEIQSNGFRYSSYRLRKSRISLKPYNGSNGVNITSDPPMVDEVVGDTATFSFDITDLPRI